MSLATVRRILVPGKAERDRTSSRQWKERNRDHTRSYDNTRYRSGGLGRCSVCNKGMQAVAPTPVCSDCRHARHHEARKTILAATLTGKDGAWIAKKLGWTKHSVYQERVRMRREGWDFADSE